MFGTILSPVDPATGAVTPGAPFAPNYDLAGLDYDKATGTLYSLGGDQPIPTGAGAAAIRAGISIVDPTTAELTPVVDLSDQGADVYTFAIAGILRHDRAPAPLHRLSRLRTFPGPPGNAWRPGRPRGYRLPNALIESG